MADGNYAPDVSPRLLFVEAEVLVAVMDGDIERAEQLLEGFLPGEMVAFERQVVLLGDLITRCQQRRRHA